MTRSMSAFAIALGALALSFGACNCGDAPCGPGTKLNDNGECVPEDSGEGEGEGDGEGEGEGEGELECGPGTVINGSGTACVPECQTPFVYNDDTDQCECAAGLIQTMNGCMIDPNLCTEGTVFDDATMTCIPLTAQPRGDDETTDGEPVIITLPAEDDKPLEIGGVTDRPTFGLNDVDVFLFTAPGGTRLRISTVSFGAEAASFVLAGVEDPLVQNNIGFYARYGFSEAERTATREVVLPVDGQYAIQVTEKSTFSDVFGILPTGGPDYTYNLVIDVLPPGLPNTISTIDPVTGNLGAVDQHAAATTLVPVGSFIAANLTSASATAAATIWTVANGQFLEFAAPLGLFNQVGGGTRFFVDYVYNLDASQPLDYTLTIDDIPSQDGPTPGVPLEGTTNGEDFSFFTVDLQANHVYRMRAQFPESTTVGPFVVLVDSGLQALGTCFAFEFDPDSDGPEFECRVYATDAEAGSAYFAVVDGQTDGLNFPNNNVRLFLDESPVDASISAGLDDIGTPIVTAGDAPPLDPGTWAGPWYFVSTADIVDTTMSADATVNLNVFDRGQFQEIQVGLPSYNTIPTPGFQSYLVQATGGPGTGTFNFTVGTALAPFDVELELNNDVTNANNLPLANPTAGVVAAGDEDIYRVVANAAGMLTVHVTAPPPPLLDAMVVEVTVFAADGTTEIIPLSLAGSLPPLYGFPEPAAFVEAGTYFVRVAPYLDPANGFVGGAYSIDWEIDTDFVAPPSCLDPALIAVGETDGTNAGAEAMFQPADTECLPFDPNAYAGPEAVYLVDVPDGATLVARITAADFDHAVVILDAENCQTDACVAGSDGPFGNELEEAFYLNDSGADKRMSVIVDGFGGATGTFTLEIVLFGDVCRIGQMECQGDDLMVCNGDGSGFDTVTCGAGCSYDAFEQRGECDPFCGDGTGNPQQRCASGTTLEVCRADQGGYEPTTCAVACTGDATDGLCTFGLCATLDATACEVDDINGDATNDAVIVQCNADASEAVRSSCDSAATCVDTDSCSSNASPLQLCVPNASTCASDIEDSCDATGFVQTLRFCEIGCNGGGTACFQPFGESCADAGNVPFPADGTSDTYDADTTGALDDFDPGPACPYGTNATGDLVTSFTATESTEVVVRKDAFDGVVYRYDTACGGAVAACVDDFGADPTLDTMTFDAVAGTTYFIVIEPYGFAGGPFTLEITNN